jgi:competence protein ComEC
VRRKPRFLSLIAGIVLYCLLTGASEPVVRASIMASVMAAAFLFGRDPDVQNAFSLSLLAMLCYNPRLLFDPGFQLSYASVFALIVLYPRLRQLLGVCRVAAAPVRWLCEGLLVSFSAWLATVPFVAHYFRVIAPGAVLINLFAAPLAGFITLCGFSVLLTDALLPPFCRFIALTGDYALALMVQIVNIPVPVVNFR